MNFTYASLIIQTIIILMVTFIDFGFDHPGQFGLDFGHLLLCVSIFSILFFIGLVRAIIHRRASFFIMQLALLAFGFLGIFCNEILL